MTSAPANQPLPRRRPRFLWRGLLIVLPALAMAGFGFVSLRQDRLLARHQAAEEAEQLTRELVEHHLPAVLRLDLPVAGEARPTDLVTVAEETTQVMRSYAAERKVAIDRRVTGDPFAVQADAAALRQVLVNLVRWICTVQRIGYRFAGEVELG